MKRVKKNDCLDWSVEALQQEIDRLMNEIDRAYRRLGRCLYTVSEQETASINEMTDRVVDLKQKLRILREKDTAETR